MSERQPDQVMEKIRIKASQARFNNAIAKRNEQGYRLEDVNRPNGEEPSSNPHVFLIFEKVDEVDTDE